MSAVTDAKAHLSKAQQFLLAAEVSLDGRLWDPAASNAILAGINAKDAMCLHLTGRTGKADNHQEAVRELKHAGPVAAQNANHLQRLLSLKALAQYQSRSVSAAKAAKAVHWATEMVDSAAVIITGG